MGRVLKFLDVFKRFSTVGEMFLPFYQSFWTDRIVPSFYMGRLLPYNAVLKRFSTAFEIFLPVLPVSPVLLNWSNRRILPYLDVFKRFSTTGEIFLPVLPVLLKRTNRRIFLHGTSFTISRRFQTFFNDWWNVFTGLTGSSVLIESSYLFIWDVSCRIMTFPPLLNGRWNVFTGLTGPSELIESSYLSIWDVF